MRRPRHARGFTLIEMMVYVAIFAMVAEIVAMLTVQAWRFLHTGVEAVQQRSVMEWTLARMERDIRAARGLPDAWGTWRAGPDTLILDRPGGAVVYRFQDGALRRGSASGADRPMAWDAFLEEVPLARVAFERPPEAPGAVRVTIERAYEEFTIPNSQFKTAARAWQFTAAARGVAP